MPAYNNPYYGPTYTPVNYGGPMYGSYPQAPQQMPMQQSYSPAPVQVETMKWVEGEIGAKAFQMPAGWPANTPIPLWDSTDTVIYLKSMNQMGMPNPMQKLRYTMEEQPQQALLSGSSNGSMSGNGYSGNSQQSGTDMSQYVTKHDLEQFRNEMRSMQQSGNQNRGNSGSNNAGVSQNRAGDH